MVQRSGAAQCNVGNVSQGKNLFIFFTESLFGAWLGPALILLIFYLKISQSG